VKRKITKETLPFLYRFFTVSRTGLAMVEMLQNPGLSPQMLPRP